MSSWWAPVPEVGYIGNITIVDFPGASPEQMKKLGLTSES